MRIRRLAILGVVGLMLGIAGPAAGHHNAGHSGGPPDRGGNAQAERLCERNNGVFIDLDGLAYVCVLPTAATGNEIRQAARLCERQGGVLFVAVGNLVYTCVLPGGTPPADHDRPADDDHHGGPQHQLRRQRRSDADRHDRDRNHR